VNQRIVALDPAPALTPAESELVVTAGLVNAHAHLDLGALAGRIDAGASFLAWVGRIIEARAALTPSDVARGVERSVDALLDTGTTSVIDIDGEGVAGEVTRACSLRTVELREVIDGSPAEWSERSEAALAGARTTLALPTSELHAFGVSPHGTHTVSDALLSRLSALQLPEPVPVANQWAVHWAETPEECEWLERGTGPFAAWLGPSPGLSGTERLAAAGLLDGALLIHGNHPQEGEIERAARARATVVHCPGSHRFFGRGEFPARRYLTAGVMLALGTDSWASNESLDMRREMCLARETLGLSAEEVWRMATEGGAAHLPWSHVTGRLDIGAAADLALFKFGETAGDQGVSGGRILERLTSDEVELAAVFVAGERVRG